MIALPPSLAITLRGHKAQLAEQKALFGIPFADTDLVFAHLDGSPLDPTTVSHAFNKVARRVGLAQIRFHDLRHTHASLLLRQGVHPKVVSERLGHSTVAITLDVYSHVTPGLQEAAALRFEDAIQNSAREKQPAYSG
jgi:integrase